jgi:hypothetical protein
VFAVGVRLSGKWQGRVNSLEVILRYAASVAHPNNNDEIKRDILGGHTRVDALSSHVMFDNLAISESSAKHKEREFCLDVVAYDAAGNELTRKRTGSFYAYSHKKVLQRRGSIKLRILSRSYGRLQGGDAFHVIGSPFIQGPALCVIVRSAHGEVAVKPEWYSDSVLFFDLPPYPHASKPDLMQSLQPNAELPAQVLVSNDGGRTLSTPLDLVYLADSSRPRF